MRQTRRKQGTFAYPKSKSVEVTKSVKGNVASEVKVNLLKGTRKLKVYYKIGVFKDVPVILLQGEWIRNLGFNVNDSIIVSGENGQLIVKLEN